MALLVGVVVLGLAGSSAAASAADKNPCEAVEDGTASGGNEYGVCAQHLSRLEAGRRKAELARLAASWSAGKKRALARLARAEREYAETAGWAESVGTGQHWKGYFAAGDAEARHDEFIKLIRSLRAGRQLRARGLPAAEAAMTRAYREKLAWSRTEDAQEQVDPEDLARTQRAWIAYRDAWLELARIAYPRVRKASLAAHLTRERAGLLERIPRSFEDEPEPPHAFR